MIYTEEKKKILGENIWMRREALSIGRRDFAKRLNIARETLGHWENGYTVPSEENLTKLTKIFNCSKHDLHRRCNIPKLDFIETKEEVKKVEEIEMSDEEIVEAATELFEIPDVKPSVKSLEKSTQEKNTHGHPVVDRINKYLTINDMSQNEFARRISASSFGFMSPAGVNRVARGSLLCDNPNYERVEKYLDSIGFEVADNKIEEVHSLEPTKVVAEVKTKAETKVVETVEEKKPVEKGSISERMSCIYDTLYNGLDTLFNALEELDGLKSDIAKIEKVTAMLKEIQGL